jgi:hypothetical protein
MSVLGQRLTQIMHNLTTTHSNRVYGAEAVIYYTSIIVGTFSWNVSSLVGRFPIALSGNA